jgi:hypothetical protein
VEILEQMVWKAVLDLRRVISSLSLRMVGKFTLLWIVQASGSNFSISNEPCWIYSNDHLLMLNRPVVVSLASATDQLSKSSRFVGDPERTATGVYNPLHCDRNSGSNFKMQTKSTLQEDSYTCHP